MRKTTLLTATLATMICAAETSPVPSLMIGAGPKIGTDGFGGSVRVLIKDRFGISLNGGSTFDMDQEGGEVQGNYRFLPGRKLNPYVLIGGGIQRIDIDDMNPPQSNVVVPTVSAGAGAELFVGKFRRHGFSLEGAYRSGAVEYRGMSSTVIGQDGQTEAADKARELDHFSAKLLYHFYFVPWHTIDRDKDDDGILDKLDGCPVQAEDRDGFNDSDGCPEFDNDRDGVADSLDNCPLDSEDKDGFQDSDGCPDLDNDGDGINDSFDKCPNSAETINGFEDSDGCFDVVPEVEPVVEKVVEPEPEQVQAIHSIPASMITFRVNTSTLANSSIPVLKQLVDTLKSYPDLKLRIEGHTDNSGDANKNRVLSKDRADRVKLYLTNSGITEDRLTTEGFGPDKPVADNSTDQGRRKNRRVELIPIQ